MASTTTGHGSWSLWDDVSVITGDQVQAFTGAAAFSQVTPPVGIPDSSQVTRVTLDLIVSTDGSAAPGQNVAPLIQFGLTSDNENGHVFARYTLGASPHTELPLDTAQHALRYDTDIDFWGSGGPAGFAADVLNGADPLVMYVGGQQLSSGGYIIYYTGMVFTFYWEGVDTPCNTTVDLDLSTATILTKDGNPTGVYADGVIYGNEVDSTLYYPELAFPGVQLSATNSYLVESTYDPSSPHDSGGRLRIISAFRPGFEQADLDAGGALGNLYDGFLGGTDDTMQIAVGPGIQDWDDATYGVAQGYTTFAFESDRLGALSSIRIQKKCAFAAPPLRLTNRDDQFASARRMIPSSRSRQGGNRMTGYL